MSNAAECRDVETSKAMLKYTVIVAGTSARGGIRSVIMNYANIGFYGNYDYQFIETHREGSLFARIWSAAKGIMQVIVALISGKVSLIHAHASMRGSFWRKCILRELAGLCGVPFILHIHGSEFEHFYNSSHGVTRYLIKRTLEKSTNVIVLSEYWRRFVDNIVRANVTIIENFVPDQYGSVAINQDRAGMLFLGVIGERKGAFDLIQAVSRIPVAERRFKLFMAGNGEVARAKEMVEALGVADCVEVIGWVDGERKESLIESCGVFILPSHNEGLPIAILEAMNAGMAIITCPVGGIPEVIESEHNGILIEPGDIDSLAEAIRQIAKNADERTRLAFNARADYCLKHSPKVSIERMQNIYMNALGKTR